MADRGGLQLLPETRKKIDVKIPGENKLLSIGGVILVVTVSLAIGLYFYKNSLESRLMTLDTEIISLEQERNKQAEQNILVFNKQVLMLSGLLNNHAYWTEVFSKIEELTQNQVQFNTLNTSLSQGRINFRATAANYTTIARQIAAFLSNESITDISLNQVNTLTTGRLEFDMQITFDKNKIFQR